MINEPMVIKNIIQEFVPRFTPDGKVLYIGDTGAKFAYFDEAALVSLGIKIENISKMPNIIIHCVEKGWLVLIEAITAHGPIDANRKAELQYLFGDARVELVFVTAFLSRSAMANYYQIFLGRQSSG